MSYGTFASTVAFGWGKSGKSIAQYAAKSNGAGRSSSGARTSSWASQSLSRTSCESGKPGACAQ
jgi:hypothetical protein